LYKFFKPPKQKYNITLILTQMENPKHHFLTFKLLIIAIICFQRDASAIGRNSRFDRIEEAHSIPGSIVINEIMADPTPLVGLPDAEWIELFNAGKELVRLKDWELTVGSSVKVLPDSVIPAGQFIIVCAAKTAPEMKKYGKTVVLPTFPALRNSGNLLTLINATDSIVDRIDYSDSWYGNNSKKDGGWSLERIDPERVCGQPANWGASVHLSGGTPGSINSIHAMNKDITRPQIISTTAISTSMAEVIFSEAMDTLSMKNWKNYSLSGGWGFPVTINIIDEFSIRLNWGRPFLANTTYFLALGELSDPCGNKIMDEKTEVSWIVLSKEDMVINEILFNPWTGGSDFVEIYNRSAHKIPLEKLWLATRDAEGILKNKVSCSGDRTVIPPGGYFAFAEDTAEIFAFYKTPCRSCVRQVSSLPPFINDKGTVVLLTDSLLVLDEFLYSEEMHHPLLADPEGVSLERINPENPTEDPLNWQSASSEAGFATPGARNSQYLAEPLKQTVITFEQTSISPNNDGFNDELIIGYKTKTPGWTGNCRVFDISGREVLHLMNNKTLGTSGNIKWDGKDAHGQKLTLGPYVIFIEMFDLSGHVEHYRNVTVITASRE
jgi:hypothetical protein